MERNLTEVGHVCVLIIREMGAGIVAEEWRRGGELQKYFNRSNRYYCCYCYQAKLLSNRSQLAWPLSETLAVLINIRHCPFNNIVFVLNRVEGVF